MKNILFRLPNEVGNPHVYQGPESSCLAAARAFGAQILLNL